jgi:hypothetical protein
VIGHVLGRQFVDQLDVAAGDDFLSQPANDGLVVFNGHRRSLGIGPARLA